MKIHLNEDLLACKIESYIPSALYIIVFVNLLLKSHRVSAQTGLVGEQFVSISECLLYYMVNFESGFLVML